MTKPWPVIDSTAVTDRVYQAIRDRILRGEMTPGEFIRQDEISKAMGVSRTPVREALMRLVSETYVERVHRRGFRIAGESIRDLLALYPILTSLEALACQTAFSKLDAADFATLAELNRDLRRLITVPDARTAIRINQQFHRTLTAKCGNHRLSRLLDDLGSEVARLEIWSFSNQTDREQTLRDHEAILSALEHGDFAQALECLARDRMSAYNEYVAEVGPADEAGAQEKTPPRERRRRIKPA